MKIYSSSFFTLLFSLFVITNFSFANPDFACGDFYGYPGTNKTFKYAETVKVGINPKSTNEIKDMRVYVDGKLIGIDYFAPFELKLVNFLHKPFNNPFNPPSIPDDVKYVNLQSGKHQIKIVVYSKCGTTKTFQSQISVIGSSGQSSTTTRPTRYCISSAVFMYPRDNARIRKGAPVYVRVDPKKYQDINYMELYVDGRSVRKESQYPYEWAKSTSSSDAILRQLRCGKHELKVKIVDKCGKTTYIKKYVYIDCQ